MITRHDVLIFPGQRGALSNQTLRNALLALRPGRTVHGFRSTFRDWCGDATAFPREVAEAALAHKVGNAVEAAYRRGAALEKRRAAHGGLGGAIVRSHWQSATISLRFGRRSDISFGNSPRPRLQPQTQFVNRRDEPL